MRDFVTDCHRGSRIEQAVFGVFLAASLLGIPAAVALNLQMIQPRGSAGSGGIA
jgi:hypothetical protein